MHPKRQVYVKQQIDTDVLASIQGCTGTEPIQPGTGFSKPNRISETGPVLNKNRPGPDRMKTKTEPDFKNRTGFKQEPNRTGPDDNRNRTGFQKPNRI